MKLNLIILHPDNTASLKKCSTFENKVLVDKKHKPEFTEGRSIFPLETRKLFFLRRIKRFGFWVFGSKTLLEFDEGVTKIEGTSWTFKELEDYIGKLVHLSLVKEKPFSNMQIYLIIIPLFILVALRIYQFMRVGF